jgi:hypothetical protein
VKPVKDRENYIKDILKEETPEFDHWTLHPDGGGGPRFWAGHRFKGQDKGDEAEDWKEFIN